MTETRKLVGHIKTIFRYPVKSMRGEVMTEASITWNGLKGSSLGIICEGVLGGFPWLTARANSELVRYTPRYLEAEAVRYSKMVVVTPDGRELELENKTRDIQ